MIVFYLISFPLCSLLLHTPCRLSEVLSGKKTWLGRAEGHAFGMQDWSSLSRGDMVLRNSVGARTGTEKGHSGATCVKDGLFFQCMLQTWYRNSMPDPPGLCCMWNQIRWSFLALKFSYSKITFPFFPSMEGAFLHKAQPHLFLSSKDPFFFSWENSEVISLLWGLLLFVTCSLSCEKRKCLSLKLLSLTAAQAILGTLW